MSELVPGTTVLRKVLADLEQRHPGRASQYLTQAQYETEKWAAHFGLPSEEYERTRSGWCAAYAFPNASASMTQVAADFIGWLFTYDDKCERHGPTTMFESASTINRLLDTGELSERPNEFQLALHDIRSRFLDLGGAQFIVTVADSMQKYQSGLVFEIPYRLAGIPPTPLAYERIRPWSIAGDLVLDMLELECGVRVRDQSKSLRDLAIWINTCIHDLHSYPKEAAAGDPINLVAVMSADRDVSVDIAVQLVADECEALLSSLESQCLPDGDPDGSSANLFGPALVDLTRGMLSYGLTCERYIRQKHRQT
ncbi:terpene synthase family protein [Nocardia sp. NBC_00565]|uniref:terpene synthase family protein n=1 Tax=Nocardia sp. NBC_00565 TaxID=2975993 RepID=UPI002E81AB97|nr:terpene synthase family protein [Nocardia sp. NBC_00565]WUC07480.1 terpene synthase family protein [Nocardia sp. NBC_00565]